MSQEIYRHGRSSSHYLGGDGCCRPANHGMRPGEQGPPRLVSSFKDCTSPPLGDSTVDRIKTPGWNIGSIQGRPVEAVLLGTRSKKLLGLTEEVGKWIADGALKIMDPAVTDRAFEHSVTSTTRN